jgi:hypothetical protein
MESLVIEETKSTPSVNFNPNTHILQINGQSYPENAFKFYEPVLAWTDLYLDTLGESSNTMMELHLPYINTSSTKCFMMLLEKLDEAYQAGKSISIRWFCNEDNESEYECAEEFREDLSIPFEIIVKSGE